MSDQDEDFLLTWKEVEDRFGISKRYLEVADVKGSGPKRIVIGRLVRYRVKDIREWIDAHAQEAGSPSHQGRA